jgi:hypothetical protein
MRLGLLGPSAGHDAALERAARYLFDSRVDRAIYLGIDQSLDRIIEAWAEHLVGGNPDEAAVFARATEQCLHSDADAIDDFLRRERERRALKLFESLPGEATRAIELLDGKVAVVIYDKAYLDEEDILPASLLVFGKNRDALVKRVGRRWFLSPGSFAHAGLMILDDEENGIRATFYDGSLSPVEAHELHTSRGAKLRVSGSG